MICALEDPQITGVLKRLHEAAETNDPPIIAAALGDGNRASPATVDSDIASFLDDAYIPVSPEVGRLLYALARGSRSEIVVEFGTSFGISTIYLAGAIRDHGAGKVITTEINHAKAERARRNINEAGLAEYVQIWEGDALKTLRNLDDSVDLLLLDGWKDLYLPVLKLVEPKLRIEGLVLADDLDLFPHAHRPFLDYITEPRNGYAWIEIPLGDRIGAAVRHDRAALS